MKRFFLALLLAMLASSALAQNPPGSYGPANASSGGANPGTFTFTQQDPFLFNINGCSPSTVYTSNGVNPNNKVFDGLTGCINGPASGTLNAFSVGVAGLTQNNDPGTTGQNGWAGMVGVAGQGYCSATGPAHCWGGNFSAVDKAGNTGNFLAGVEVDMLTNNTGSTGFGYLAAYFGNGQPTGDSMPAYAVGTPSGSARFTSGFKCNNASIAVALAGCVEIGKQVAAGVSPSQLFYFTANDGTSDYQVGFDLRQSHVFQFSGSMPLAARSVSTYVTSTASLSPNQLVKIDAANPDAVVVCTTTDTSCDGFVAEIVSADCGAASTICPVVMGSGSKVQGILGTGTCAIGNFVIVDTTTNGRVKCQATIPAQGAYIGRALAAQSTVGNAFDVLTKFQ